MKEQFEEMNLKLVYFDSADLIVTSGEESSGECEEIEE